MTLFVHIALGLAEMYWPTCLSVEFAPFFHQNAKFKPRRPPWMQKTPKFGWRHTLLVAKVLWSVAKQLWSVARVLRSLIKYYDRLLRCYDRLLRCYGRLLRWYARLPKCYGCCSGDMVGC